MSEGNGELHIKEVPVLQMNIRYIPQTGEFAVSGSQGLDQVSQLGILELAKHVLMAQANAKAESPLIMPHQRYPH